MNIRVLVLTSGAFNQIYYIGTIKMLITTNNLQDKVRKK